MFLYYINNTNLKKLSLKKMTLSIFFGFLPNFYALFNLN